MPGTSLTESPLRELASRVCGGAEITLSWNERTGAVTVAVRSRDSGRHLEFTAAPAKALEAFYHPFAHAASRGAQWHDTPRAA